VTADGMLDIKLYFSIAISCNGLAVRFEQPGQYSVGLIVRDEHDQYGYRNQQVDVRLTPEGVVLPVSNTVLGELASADPRSQTRPNAFADRYRLTSIPSGQELVIEMTSEQFDSYLYLYDEFNRLLRQDNNSGRAQQARIRYTPVHQGDLLVEATSFKDNTLGSYRLSLELGQQRPIREVPIEASTSLSNPLQNLLIARLPSSFETQFVLWDFGDGSPVAATDIAVVSHVYPHSGQFAVTVTAMDAQGQELIGEQSFIINQQPFIPVARFRASPLFGESPLRVFFNNESFSSIDGDELSYVWQFGDGKVSTLLNPAHTFSQEGTYQVILHAYSGRNQQSASYSVPISVIDRSSPLIPVVNPARLRPQVLMAGFDPMLVDVLDTDVKVFAIVRPGAEPIQNVRIMQNNSDFILVMQHVATYANGDQRYEAVITLAKGELPVTTYTNLFGDQLGQFRIQVIDQAEQFHAFPNLEIGHNPPLTAAPTSLHIEPLRQAGIRRRQPQVLAAGFDPALVDINESEFLVKAIVREGLLPIQQVLLMANQAEFSLPMRLQEVLPNGDKLFVVNYTYPHDTVEMGTWGHLFGDQPQQFQIKVIDQAHYVHQFPQLKIGNFPQQ